MTKKILHWTPRVIVVLFPIIVIVSTVVESFQLGFNVAGFFMMAFLATALAALAWVSWNWPIVGGIIFTAFSIIVIYNASQTSIGIDWGGVLAGGMPMFVAGMLFLAEGLSKRKNRKIPVRMWTGIGEHDL